MGFWRIGRNLIGVLLVILGLILWLTPILPGGALAILGLMLIDFPGKRRFFLKLERTRWFSHLLQQKPQLARIWKRLYSPPRGA